MSNTVSFDEAETITQPRYGKFISIGDGGTAKRDSKTDFRVTVIGRLTGIRKDEEYSDEEKTRRKYDMVLDGGELVTVNDAAGLGGITTDLIGSVLRISYQGMGKAKAGQSASKLIEVKVRSWDSLTANEQARFQPAEDGDAAE